MRSSSAAQANRATPEFHRPNPRWIQQGGRRTISEPPFLADGGTERMTSHGFIARVLKKPVPVDRVSISHTEEVGHAAWSREACFMSSRPFRATVESERERQPIATATVILSYVGRVDNREELCDLVGCDVASATDGELLVYAHARWGAEFPYHVPGEYSFALIDRRDGRLVAGRDALGLTQLYYYVDDEAIWTASSLELLVSALQPGHKIDIEAVVEYLAEGGLPLSDRTIHEDVRRVPAACVLIQSEHSLSSRRYWSPDLWKRVTCRRREECDEGFRELLFRGVRSALRSNGPICSDLSGGLDSSTVTSVAASLKRSGDRRSGELLSYTRVASTTSGSDESVFQNAMGAAYPLRSLVLDMDRYPYFEDLPLDHLVAPSTGVFSGAAAKAQAALFDSEGIRVRMTGLGGDQIFCGGGFPPLHLSEWLWTFRWLAWCRGIREWSSEGNRSVWYLLSRCSAGALLKTDKDSWSCQIQTWWHPTFRARVAEYERDTQAANRSTRLCAGAAREYQYRKLTALQQDGGIGIATCETRHPLLYRPLVEYMLSLGWEHKLSPTEDRVIQRRALKGILPEKIRTRRDKGDHTPLIVNGLRDNWSNVSSIVRGERLGDLGIVEPRAFFAACQRLRHGRVGTPKMAEAPFLLAALSLEVWLSGRERPRPSIHDRSFAIGGRSLSA
jgi:asparagine synthase (glutamine-hydrolysing)